VRALIAAAVLLCVALPTRADSGPGTPGNGHVTEPQKSPAERLAEARDQFRLGAFARVIELINPLLYPEIRVARQRDIVEAHVLYGVSLFETGDRKNAAREFEAALSADDAVTLDENQFSVDARNYFDEIKKAKQERDQTAAELAAAAAERERLRQAIKNLRIVENRPFWVNFMPFGAGQFQNGDTKLGIFFAATEGAAAATSATIFIYLVNKYGYNGQVPKDDAGDARLLQQIAIGADVVFYVTAFAGVVHAIHRYKRQKVLDPSSVDEDLLDPDQKTKPKPKPKTSSSIFFHPIPIPDGAGAALTWEF
jgi:hypothetical protein